MLGVSIGLVGVILTIGSQGEAAGSPGRAIMFTVGLLVGLLGAVVSFFETPGFRR